METELARLESLSFRPGPGGDLIYSSTVFQKINDMKNQLAEAAEAIKTKTTAREKAIASLLLAGFHST